MEEMAVSTFCYQMGFIHPIVFFPHSLHFVLFLCVYENIFTCCLGEDKMMRLYNEEKKRVLERVREEMGRPLREVQLVENLQACQFQLVHSELWTQHFYFPRPLRERQMFCLSALQLSPLFTTFRVVPVGKLAPQLDFLALLLQLPGFMSN